MSDLSTASRLRFEFPLSRNTVKKTLASGNEMISANDDLHYMTKSKITRHLRDLGEQAIHQLQENPFDQFSPENPCHMVITVKPPTRRRMDAPNWYPTIKPLVDGMTDAELFTDDNDHVITSMTFLRGPKMATKQYLIVIDIYPGIMGGFDVA